MLIDKCARIYKLLITDNKHLISQKAITPFNLSIILQVGFEILSIFLSPLTISAMKHNTLE
jgi:hypothetical protein